MTKEDKKQELPVTNGAPPIAARNRAPSEFEVESEISLGKPDRCSPCQSGERTETTTQGE